jgi:DMSO/TMAO reductase YedYZ molybdopterin-dependent catalytic subunit
MALGLTPAVANPLPAYTGPDANPFWNSPGPFVTFPQKAPLIRLTDRSIQLETPRAWFATDFTPNAAFFVRWHLSEVPNQVDLSRWRLHVQDKEYALHDLMTTFAPTTIAAVNQCSGNSRSRLVPRVPGGQWGNGAMGNARWTGARLRDVLEVSGVARGTTGFVQFQGLERGLGPPDKPSGQFLKSLPLDDPVLDECVVAWAMNGEPLPILNGFPVRLIVPSYFATYWMKGLTWIRILDHADENFWMKTGYRIPATNNGNTTPAAMAAGGVPMVPITRMPVRSFFVLPDGSTKLPIGMPVSLEGVAFSGYGRIVRVETSDDKGADWQEAELGPDHGPWSFRRWQASWTPNGTGPVTLMCRATDEAGHVQTDEPIWNPGGYLWNRIERQTVDVGESR